jgi:transposase
MKKKRKVHSTRFKSRIALEAVRGLKTINQIAADNEVHPVQVSQWKKELLEGAEGIFEREGTARKQAAEAEKKQEKLERKVGQLVVEVDWLTKKCEELGIE